MVQSYRETLYMNPRGDFLPRPARLSWPMRIGLTALLVAVVAAGFSAAALFLLIARFLLPVAIVAGIVAYLAFRLQLWRLRQARAARVYRP